MTGPANHALSLEAIFGMILRTYIEPPVFMSLWPSLYSWVVWFDAYQDLLGEDDRACGGSFLHFTSVYNSKDATDLVSSAPGFRRLLTRCWIVVNETQNPLRAAFGFGGLTTMLFPRMRPTSTEHVDDILEGAGGSLSDLALLVVGYIDQFSADLEARFLRRDRRLHGYIFTSWKTWIDCSQA